jgi:hypothetical protein
MPFSVRRSGMYAACRTVSVTICQRPAAFARHRTTRAQRSRRIRTEHTGHVQMCEHERTPVHRVCQLPGRPLAEMPGPESRHAQTPHWRSRGCSVTARSRARSVELASLPSRVSLGLAFRGAVLQADSGPRIIPPMRPMTATPLQGCGRPLFSDV